MDADFESRVSQFVPEFLGDGVATLGNQVERRTEPKPRFQIRELLASLKRVRMKVCGPSVLRRFRQELAAFDSDAYARMLAGWERLIRDAKLEYPLPFASSGRTSRAVSADR